MDRTTFRPVIASLLACAALALGCGDGGSGVVEPDGATGDVTGDQADAAGDAGDDAVADAAPDAPPSDEPQPGDAPPPDAAPDAPDMDAAADAPADAPADVMPPPDAPADAPPMDAPMDVTPDAPMDVTPDAPVDMPPTDTGPMATPGHRGTALVSGGAVMRSPSYRMVSTLGQSTIHQTVMRSTGFRLRGGLVGATGGSR